MITKENLRKIECFSIPFAFRTSKITEKKNVEECIFDYTALRFGRWFNKKLTPPQLFLPFLAAGHKAGCTWLDFFI